MTQYNNLMVQIPFVGEIHMNGVELAISEDEKFIYVETDTLLIKLDKPIQKIESENYETWILRIFVSINGLKKK